MQRRIQQQRMGLGTALVMAFLLRPGVSQGRQQAMSNPIQARHGRGRQLIPKARSTILRRYSFSSLRSPVKRQRLRLHAIVCSSICKVVVSSSEWGAWTSIWVGSSTVSRPFCRKCSSGDKVDISSTQLQARVLRLSLTRLTLLRSLR